MGFIAGPPWTPEFWAKREAACFLANGCSGDEEGRGSSPYRESSCRQRTVCSSSHTLENMRTRQLGSSDLHITPLGFRAPRATPVATVSGYGINWIDTSGVEPLAEEWGSSAETRPYFFAKSLWFEWTREGPEEYVPRRFDAIRRACEETLLRLKTDALDLYHINWPRGGDPAWSAHAWASMAELQRHGQVRWIGLDGCGIEELELARQIAPVTALRLELELLGNSAQRETLEHCAATGTGVIGLLPTICGISAQAQSHEAGARFALALKLGVCTQDEWFRDPRAQEARLKRTLTIVDEFSRMGEERGRSASAMAVAWALRLPAVAGVALHAVGGVGEPEDEFHLSDGDFARIEALRG